MKKKLCLVICLCMLLLGVSACGEDPKKADYNGMTYDQLESAAVDLASGLAKLTDEQLDETLAYYEQYEDVPIVDLITQWKELKPDLGKYEDLGEFAIDKSGKTLTTTQVMKFTERDITLTCVYNYLDMQVTDMTLDEIFTLGEKMQKAAMNTVMGLGTVFMILILISLVIYCFKVIPYLQQKAKAKNAPAAEPVPEPAAPAVPAFQTQEPAMDETELIAVIAAAVAASEGALSADGFVVRSIKRRR